MPNMSGCSGESLLFHQEGSHNVNTESSYLHSTDEKMRLREAFPPCKKDLHQPHLRPHPPSQGPHSVTSPPPAGRHPSPCPVARWRCTCSCSHWDAYVRGWWLWWCYDAAHKLPLSFPVPLFMSQMDQHSLLKRVQERHWCGMSLSEVERVGGWKIPCSERVWGLVHLSFTASSCALCH